jgi:CRISPR-associated protein Csx10
MKALRYRMHLLEPVLVSEAGAGEENSAIGFSYIPGSALRGALASRWLTEHSGVDMAADPAARAWFLDGTVCYLNAYPEYEGERTLPVPASWFVDKEQMEEAETTIFDLAVDSNLNVPIKPPKGGSFCHLESDPEESETLETEPQTTLVGVNRIDQVHISLDEVNRRGKGNQIFRYEAIASGQSFIGAVIAAEHQDLMEISRLLTAGDLLLGVAHHAGYGRIRVQVLEEIATGWRECPMQTNVDGRLVVTLLSPVILRSNEGQAGWDGGHALARALGLPAETMPAAGFGRIVLMGGYNRKWNLPLPQAWALAAGSVFVFNVAAVDKSSLWRAVDLGIGERRAEGFGRIAVNRQLSARIMRRPPQIYQDDNRLNLSADSRQLAAMMAQRRLRFLLDRALAQRVDQDTSEIQNTPTNAQLSAIRQAALTGMLHERPSMQPLLDYLKQLKETGRQQLGRCRMGLNRLSLLDWLTERANKLDVDSQLLQGQSPPKVAGEAALLTPTIRVEYTFRLINGVMQTLAKQNRETKR